MDDTACPRDKATTEDPLFDSSEDMPFSNSDEASDNSIKEFIQCLDRAKPDLNGQSDIPLMDRERSNAFRGFVLDYLAKRAKILAKKEKLRQPEIVWENRERMAHLGDHTGIVAQKVMRNMLRTYKDVQELKEELDRTLIPDDWDSALSEQEAVARISANDREGETEQVSSEYSYQTWESFRSEILWAKEEAVARMSDNYRQHFLNLLKGIQQRIYSWCWPNSEQEVQTEEIIIHN